MTRSVKLIISFFIILYCSYAYLYFFNVGISMIKPLYWFLITMAFSILLLILKSSYKVYKFPFGIGVWVWLYLCDTVICFFYSSQDDVAIQALIESFEMSLLLVAFITIFRTVDFIKESRLALMLIALFSVLMNLVDFIHPLWSVVPGRAAGLFVNPTISGKMLVLAMTIGAPIVPRKLRLLFCAIVGLGVLVTFSRGAWFFWVVAVVGLAVTGYLNITSKKTSIFMVSLLAMFVLYTVLTGGVLDYLSRAGFNEYLTPNTIARLGGETPFSDPSSISRMDVAKKAWEVFSDHPWLGSGLADDREWSIGAHNTYLRMATEGGVVRLAIFITLLIILWHMTDSIGRITLLVYSLSCLTSHDNLRQPALMVILALIATATIRETRNKQLSSSESYLTRIKQNSVGIIRSSSELY